MADKSKIEWTDSTWNPVRGCSLKSAGCTSCYAMHVAARFNGEGQPYEGLTIKTSQGPKWNGKIVLVREALNQPIYWKRPRKIFVNSMSDLFHESVPDSYIDQVFAVMALCTQHTFQILTKRPERMRDYCKTFSWKRVVENCTGSDGVSTVHKHSIHALMNHFRLVAGDHRVHADRSAYPIPNVWLGVSVEDQDSADSRLPVLLDTPAAIRWISGEPLLGPINLAPKADKTYQLLSEWYGPNGFDPTGSQPRQDRMKAYFPKIDWVVVGGESGPNARPMHPNWARSLRDQCAAAGVPFLFKQWGEWLPGDMGPRVPLRKWCEIPSGETKSRSIRLRGDDAAQPVQLMARVGKVAAGRLLDGVLHDGYPVRHA